MSDVGYSKTAGGENLVGAEFGHESRKIVDKTRISITGLMPTSLAAEKHERRKLELLHNIVFEFRERGKPLVKEAEVPAAQSEVIEKLSNPYYYDDLREHGNVDVRNNILTDEELQSLSIEIWRALRWQAARTAKAMEILPEQK